MLPLLLSLLSLSLSIKFITSAPSIIPNQCQSATGALLPTAPGGDSCQDIFSGCVAMFGIGAAGPLTARTTPGTPRPRGGVRDDSCNDPNNVVYAQQCPYTCATCCTLPAYACANPASAMNCTTSEPLCFDATQGAQVRTNCPANCGVCGMPPPTPTPTTTTTTTTAPVPVVVPVVPPPVPPLFPDANPITISPIINPPPQIVLPPPIIVLPPPPAPLPPLPPMDMADNCRDLEYLCDSDVYFDKLQERCAYTCRDALQSSSSSSTDSDCDDAEGRTRCRAWERNGFCDEDGFYSEAEQERRCALTCDLC